MENEHILATCDLCGANYLDVAWQYDLDEAFGDDHVCPACAEPLPPEAYAEDVPPVNEDPPAESSHIWGTSCRHPGWTTVHIDGMPFCRTCLQAALSAL